MNKENRIVWVDWTKALLICLVVLGHSGSIFTKPLYLFHIPAFFCISGYLCNYEKAEQGSLKSSKWMIFAIIIYNVIFMCIKAVKVFYTGIGFRLAEEDTLLSELIIKPTYGIFACNYMGNPWTHPLVGQFWFVWVLIIIKFLFRYLRNYSDKKLIIINMCCIIVVALWNITGFRTLYYIDRVILALPFFITGQLCRRGHSKVCSFILSSGRKTQIVNILVMACGLAYYHFLYEYGRPDMFHFKIGHSAILYYACSFAGTSLLIHICKRLDYNKIIKNISNGTFVILALHLYMLNFNFISFDPTCILFLGCILTSLYPVIIFFDKYFPVMLGKRHY